MARRDEIREYGSVIGGRVACVVSEIHDIGLSLYNMVRGQQHTKNSEEKENANDCNSR